MAFYASVSQVSFNKTNLVIISDINNPLMQKNHNTYTKFFWFKRYGTSRVIFAISKKLRIRTQITIKFLLLLLPHFDIF